MFVSFSYALGGHSGGGEATPLFNDRTYFSIPEPLCQRFRRHSALYTKVFVVHFAARFCNLRNLPNKDISKFQRVLVIFLLRCQPTRLYPFNKIHFCILLNFTKKMP